jgi:serine/threonine protein kinase
VDCSVGELSGYGDVYLAHCSNTDDDQENYVMKTIEFRSMPKDDILNEIRFQRYVYDKDPSLTIPVVEAWEGDNCISFIMPMLRYTVKNLLQDLETKEDMRKFVMVLTDMVHRLHAIGISHNDTHLNNFMLDKHGNVRFIDFGKASELSVESCRNDYNEIYTDWLTYTDNLRYDGELVKYRYAKEIGDLFGAQIEHVCGQGVNGRILLG